MVAETKVLRLVVDSRGAEQGSRRVTRSLTDVKKSSREAAGGIQNVETRLSSLRGIAITASAALASVGVGLSIREALGEFSQFNRGLIAVGKTADISGAELEGLGLQVQLLARDVPSATTELLGIAQAAGQLGVKGTDNILRFTETVGKLGGASNLAGEEAATALARILTVTGTSISEVDRLGSVIVRLGNNFAATESEIAGVATRVAQSTAQFDIAVAEVAGISAALKAVGVEAEAGGTVIGRAFQSINDAVRQGGEELTALTRITGQTGEQLRATFQEDPTAAFAAFVEGLGRIKAEGGDVAAALKNIDLEGVRVIQVLGTLASRSDVLTDALGQASDEFEANTALNKEAFTAAQSFSAQMQLVANDIDQAAVSLGRGLAPAILDATGNFREFVQQAVDSGQVADIAEDIGGAFKVAADNTDLLTVAAVALVARGVGPMLISVKAGEVGLLQMAAASAKSEIASLQAARAQVVVTEANLRGAQAAVGSALQTARLTGSYTGLRTATIAAQQAQVAHTAALRASSVAAVTARGAFTALRGVMAFFGGPLGLAITGLSAAYLLLGNRTDEAREAQERFNDIAERAREIGQDLTTASNARSAALAAEARHLAGLAQAEVTAAEARLEAARISVGATEFSFLSEDTSEVSAARAALARANVNLAVLRAELGEFADGRSRFFETLTETLTGAGGRPGAGRGTDGADDLDKIAAEAQRRRGQAFDFLSDLEAEQLRVSGNEIALVNSVLEERLRAIRASNLSASQAADARVVVEQIAATEISQIRERQAEEATELAEQQLRESRRFADGARLAFEDYADFATNASLQVQEFGASSFRGLEDAAVSFARTGKLEFRSLVDSMIADLTRFALRAAVLGPFANAIGDLFVPTGSGTGTGQVAAATAGGASGLGFAHGGSFEVPPGFPADSFSARLNLTSGERVTVQRPGQGGIRVNQTIINETGAEVQTQERSDGNGGLDQVIRIIRKDTEQQMAEGNLGRVTSQRFGLGNSPVGR